MNYDLIIDAKINNNIEWIKEKILKYQSMTFSPKLYCVCLEYEYPKIDNEIMQFLRENVGKNWVVSRCLNGAKYSDVIKNIESPYFAWVTEEEDHTDESFTELMSKLNDKTWLMKGPGFSFVHTNTHRMVAGNVLLPTKDMMEIYIEYQKEQEENGELDNKPQG